MQDEYKENFVNLKNILNKENIHAYFIKIPKTMDLSESARHPEWRYEHLSVKANWTKEREDEIRKYLSKFTELSYEEARTKILYGEKQKFYYKNEAKRTIYLVGPCIIAGWEGIPGDTLCELLNKELIRLRLDYNIVQVVISSYSNFNNKRILEYDIKRNDIVLFIDNLIDDGIADINFSYIYNNYEGGKKWLYSDEPIHTSRKGNELIIQELLRKVIIPLARNSLNILNEKIIHTGKKQFTYEESVELQNYLKELVIYKKIGKKSSTIIDI